MEKRFKYLIYFLHFKHIYVQFQWEINVFLHLLSCFSVVLNTFPLLLSPSFAGLSRRRLFSTRIITSIKAQMCEPWTWSHLVLSVPVCVSLCFNICLSMPHLFQDHLFVLFHLALKITGNKNRADFRNSKLKQILFFTASELISKAKNEA